MISIIHKISHEIDFRNTTMSTTALVALIPTCRHPASDPTQNCELKRRNIQESDLQKKIYTLKKHKAKPISETPDKTLKSIKPINNNNNKDIRSRHQLHSLYSLK